MSTYLWQDLSRYIKKKLVHILMFMSKVFHDFVYLVFIHKLTEIVALRKVVANLISTFLWASLFRSKELWE